MRCRSTDSFLRSLLTESRQRSKRGFGYARNMVGSPGIGPDLPAGDENYGISTATSWIHTLRRSSLYFDKLRVFRCESSDPTPNGRTGLRYPLVPALYIVCASVILVVLLHIAGDNHTRGRHRSDRFPVYSLPI